MTGSGDCLRFEAVALRRSGVDILQDVNARVPAGSSTAIFGPNGAGKTSLLLILLGELRCNGRVVFPDGRPRIGYVPQKMVFDRSMPITVAEFLAMSVQTRPLWLGRGRKARCEAEQLLEAVRGEHLSDRLLGMLSGGELQRVLLALALQQKPELLILDEPAAGVDIQGGQIFCEILEKLRRDQGFTQLMVSHDLATVTHHAEHVIALNRRVIAEGSPIEVFTAETLTALFGLHMNLVDARAMPAGQTVCNASCCRKEDRDGDC